MTNPAIAKGVIPSLDGLRAVAIAIVFAGHAGLSSAIPGGLGVTIFFFLSGFLITTLLVREHARYGSISFPAFFARRVLRLMPPLLATLLAAGLIVRAGIAEGALNPNTIFSQIFFYYNYFAVYGDADGSIRGFGILWSLSVEEHFYLIWPFMFLLIARGRLDIRHVILLLILIPAWRYFRYMYWLDTEWIIYSLTDTRFDSLLYGCLLALLSSGGQAERLFPDERPARFFLLCGGVLAILVSLVLRDPTFRSTLRYSVQGLALMPIFHYAVTRPDLPIFRPLNWGWVRWLGVMSYTFYICHYVIIDVIEDNMSAMPYPVFFLAAGGLALLWSAIVFYGLENPLKPMRSRLTGHAQRRRQAEG